MKEGWYDSANYIVRTKGVNEKNGWHMYEEELNAKYGCENYEEFCKMFEDAEKNNPDKFLQMIIDLGPRACEDSYNTCESPEVLDMLIAKRIREEREGEDKHPLLFYFDDLKFGVFEKLPHGRQVQSTYINQLIFSGLRKQLGLEKMTKRDIKDARRAATVEMAEASNKMAHAEAVERRGREMIATALNMQARKAPHGRQRQQLRALGFVA